jgi:predicted signal transduction protein with EAL and GGDEF domain
MNHRAENVASKILLAFDTGGIWPLPPEKFAAVREHVRSILGRAMESKAEKKARKWNDWQRVRKEAGA